MGFEDPENQCFLRKRCIFKVKVSEKGGIFLTWRTLMGLTNSLRVGVPGVATTDLSYGLWGK